jgi:Linalool dehydratase/isomerase
MNSMKRVVVSVGALVLAAVIWIPCVHLLFARNTRNFRQQNGLSPTAKALAARHLELWTDPKLKTLELDRMRHSNAEWDFMGRTFLVWSLAEMSLRNPAGKADYLPVMDQIIEETLRLEKERDIYFFLMPYAKARPFVMQPARSHFLDGEIALMLASRRMVEEKAEYKPLLRDLVETMTQRMDRGAVLSAESYPDECWTFDNAAALDAVRMSDQLDGGDHSDLIHRWVAMAKKKLVDPQSGLLISAYTVSGEPTYGPEGSSLWMITHCLRLLDEDFARDQYQRARKELSRGMAGFAWATEWPKSWRGLANIDSGPVIPGLEVSAGSSGMAFIGASSFGDDAYLRGLAATLDFSAFPTRKAGRLKYCASNQVGDAALLYAAVLGPLWTRVEGGKL